MDNEMLTKEKDAARKREKRKEWKAAGLCVHCGGVRVRGRFCQKGFEADKKRQKDAEIRRRDQVIKAYNSHCACCNENESRFLTVDHVNNDGDKHRREIGISRGGDKFYSWIIKNNFPQFLQLLCWNCNMGKVFNDGICPHNLGVRVR